MKLIKLNKLIIVVHDTTIIFSKVIAFHALIYYYFTPLFYLIAFIIMLLTFNFRYEVIREFYNIEFYGD